MKGPKVVLLGAGSMFFGRQCIWAMIHSDILCNGTLALVDTDIDRLNKMTKLAKLAIKSKQSPLKLEASANRLDVLKGADFVVLSFADRGVYFRGVDCKVSEKYGIRMCSGDTIGPGGIFRAMRELPKILQVTRDVENICPEAWVINYINPTAVNGIGLMRHAKVKSFALCDGLHMPHIKRTYMKEAGLNGRNEEKFDLRIAGVNHFTWMLAANYNGKDVSSSIKKHKAMLASEEKDEGHSKEKFNNSYLLSLWDVFGLCPTTISHTKEYVPFWQGKGVKKDKLPPLSIFDVKKRYHRHDEMWQEVDRYINGTIPLEEFHDKNKPDHATDVIEAMWSGKKQPFYINTKNSGSVENLPDDAFLELLCDIDMNGPKPRYSGKFPIGLRSMQMQVLDTHELTVEAIVKKDRNLLRRAMCTDPIVLSIADSDAIINELLEREAGALDW